MTKGAVHADPYTILLLYFAFTLVHDSRGIEIVNFTISFALSAGTLMSSAGTPYRLVPVRPTFTSGRADAMTGRRVDAVPHRPYISTVRRTQSLRCPVAGKSESLANGVAYRDAFTLNSGGH